MFFLYHRSTRPTGRLLAKCLGFPFGLTAPVSNDLLIRWGSSKAAYGGTQANTADAINRASDKLAAMRAMQEAGVRIPEFWTNTSLQLHSDKTVLGRNRRGSQGRDIVVYKPGEVRPATHEFFTEFIPNTREYRLHIFNGELIRVQGKYLEYPEQHTNPHIKNYAQGYRFKTPRRDLRPDRIENATKAVEALGLLWGAVDLIIGEDGYSYVLEVNTAPKCYPKTARAYIAAFVRWAAEQGYELKPDYTPLEGLTDAEERS